MAQPSAHPSMAELDALVGEWTTEVVHPLDPATTLRGVTTLEWMDGGRFLIQRSVLVPPFPSNMSLIGRTDPADARSPLLVHYFDSRGVARLLTMTLADGEWTLARDDQDFSQRFRGTFPP